MHSAHHNVINGMSANVSFSALQLVWSWLLQTEVLLLWTGSPLLLQIKRRFKMVCICTVREESAQ